MVSLLKNRITKDSTEIYNLDNDPSILDGGTFPLERDNILEVPFLSDPLSILYGNFVNDNIDNSHVSFTAISSLENILTSLTGNFAKLENFDDLKEYEHTFNMPSSEFVKKWYEGEVTPSPEAFDFLNLYLNIFNGKKKS